MSSTILVPVDFSEASHNAALYAAAIAKESGLELLLFHAYMVPTPVTEVPFVMISADELQEENENMMEKELRDLLTKTGIEGKGLVRIGIASDEIRVLCEEDKDISLIVMGMKGAGGMEKLIGSTTNNVIRKVKVPVLVVPHHTVYRPISKITYPSDFSYSTSQDLYKPLIALAKTFDAELTILHIHLTHNGESEKIKKGMTEMDKIFEGIRHQYESLEYKSVNEGIHHHLENQPADLLVMVAHVHSFLERLFARNHTEAMAYETHVPLLVLQDKP